MKRTFLALSTVLGIAGIIGMTGTAAGETSSAHASSALSSSFAAGVRSAEACSLPYDRDYREILNSGDSGADSFAGCGGLL